MVLASEAGVLDVAPEDVVAKGRLKPGKMFLVDTEAGRIVDDEEVKSALAKDLPYEGWLHAGLLKIAELPDRDHVVQSHDSVLRRQLSFGYTEEELKILLAPMAEKGAEPIGSMGTDTPPAVLSKRSRLLYDYFKQNFAQVTNPPLDAIREELVTCMARIMGPERNLLAPGPASCRHLNLPYPVIDNDELAKLIHINDDGDLPGFACSVLSGLYEVDGGADALASAIERVRREASEAIAAGARTLVLSDRDSDHRMAPIPSLLLVSSVHHHLVRTKERLRVALVVESGDAREVHHIALLLGYGAAAVNPYLAFETIEDMISQGAVTGIEPAKAIRNYVQALVKGVLKIMSKMGISTVGAYTAAQVFESLGLAQDLLDEYFTGTSSKLGGVGLDVLAEEVAVRHRRAYPDNPTDRVHRGLDTGGEYAYRREGELHLFTPETVFLLQHASKTGREEVYRKYTDEVHRLYREGGTLRGLFAFRDGVREPVPLDEVEPAEAIFKRFNTGAMSYGSISAEAHETLAIAMNRLGGRSNTGEGGEDPERLYDPERRSAIKQVASGRFGVTSEYLVNADDIQIKMAQGAKPGEGGQLPPNKVYPWIARTRHSTPGVGLISPPPHHDIYSIEDLAQLIHDLKNANEHARIHVKLVSSLGVGTVAAGVSKAHADVVLISGHDGGTGASPMNSLKHAGHAVGDRPRRDPADVAAQRVARPDHRAGGRRHEDRARRRHRGAARRRGVRLRDGAPRRRGLHHDARLPPRHLPGRRRHAEPRPAQAVHRPGRARRELLPVRRRRSPGNPGSAGLPDARRGDRARRAAEHRRGRRPLEGVRARTWRRSSRCRRRPRTAARSGAPAARTTAWSTRSTARSSSSPRRPWKTRTRAHRAAGAQREPDRRHAARLGDHPPLRRRRPARGHDPRPAHRFGGPVARRVPAARASPSTWSATRTTTSARACPAAGSSSARTRKRRSPPRRRRSRATRSPTARPAARSSCAARSANGSASATPAPPWSPRASATTPSST